jgi:hypothetical protein
LKRDKLEAQYKETRERSPNSLEANRLSREVLRFKSYEDVLVVNGILWLATWLLLGGGEGWLADRTSDWP